MKMMIYAAGIAALGLGLAAPVANAQSDITGVTGINDRLDDIDVAARRSLDRSRDDYRFGNPDLRAGLSGSTSLSYVGKSGNNDSQELTFGARLRFAQGAVVQTLGFAMDFAEDSGVKTKEDVFAVYDLNYYFNDQFYAFVLGRVESNGLATLASETAIDGFVGVGPGFRIVNTPTMSWRLQAGIGLSYLENGAGAHDTETGYLASSRFFYQFNETMFLTNDTDILKSDSALRANNDLGLNLRMTDAFSTRVSYLSEYNDSRAIKTDNKVGLAVIYSF
jgi:putative salt-induced outer membrane protein